MTLYKTHTKQILQSLLVVFILNFSVETFAQNYASPLDIPLVLSANCGELRNNHFHSGLDLKTQAVENKSVYSIADGYVSRVSVSPSGYGLALYIDHPETGHTSVYGHLNSFAPAIAQYVKEQQYKAESYKVDLTPDKALFPIKKGQFVAYSGNTGGSMGAHVHFEIRETKTQKILDPLKFYKNMIADKVQPEIRGVAVYPVLGKGAVNSSSSPLRLNITKTRKGIYQPLKTPIQAWGTIGIGVKAYDRMTGTTNVYGVKLIKLFVDGKEVFRSDIESFTFGQTRMINTFADFAAWRNRSEWYIKSFIEPGNLLPFYKAENNGYINIDAEKEYAFKYELTDIYGNTFTYDFKIIGKKQIISANQKCSLFMHWDRENRFVDNTFSLILPRENLYDDVCFTLKKEASEVYLSDRIRVNNVPVPLHSKADMKIKVDKDTLANKSQYGIVQIRKGRDSWLGGLYSNGFIFSSIREFGAEYAVYYDVEAPVVEPVLEKTWLAKGAIKIRVTDNTSGVSSVRGTINGKFVLFENDIKSSVYTYYIDYTRIEKGKSQTLTVMAKDNCGNTSQYSCDLDF